MNYFSFKSLVDVNMDKDEVAPGLSREFNPHYIKALAVQYRKDQLRLRRRIWLSKLGIRLISLGHHIQHRAHLPFEFSHTAWKALAVQSIKIRRHH